MEEGRKTEGGSGRKGEWGKESHLRYHLRFATAVKESFGGQRKWEKGRKKDARHKAQDARPSDI